MAAPNLLWSARQVDVEYSRAGEVSLRMDAHIPDGVGPFPAVVLVHGGAWVTGDRVRNFQPLFAPLTSAGFAWFTISYRFATDPLMFGAAVDDVQQAVRHIASHAAKYKVDPSRIAIVGESAGGQLASMAVLGNPQLPVRAVVAIGAPTDLVSLAQNSRQVPDSVKQALSNGGLGELVLWRLRELSPVNHVNGKMPPFLLIHGNADAVVPYEQSVQMTRRIRESGGVAELYTVRGGGHNFRFWDAAHRNHLISWLVEKLGSRTSAAARP